MPPCCVAPEMGGVQTVVCVKKVKDGMPEDEWDESMPLPGDIIEGVAAAKEVDDESFTLALPAKGKSELSSQLNRLSRSSGSVWIKVRRGDAVLRIRASVASERRPSLHRRFILRAARDERHVAVLADLTLDQCSELQEKSRRVVNKDGFRFDKSNGVKYDWKKAVGTYLPDRHSTVVSSILFAPFPGERGVEPIMTRSMAWFSAAVSSGAPLIFVNIQTEPIANPDKNTLSSGAAGKSSWRERGWGRQQSPRTSSEVVQGVRLWFLPGVTEVPAVLTLEKGETRFGMDIQRTEEGFICINSVSKESAAERAGLRKLCKEGSECGHLVVVSRLDGSSLLPSSISSSGLIQCCEHVDIRDRLSFAVEQMEDVHLHIMAWPNARSIPPIPQEMTSGTLVPPASNNLRTFGCSSNEEVHKHKAGNYT